MTLYQPKFQKLQRKNLIFVTYFVNLRIFIHSGVEQLVARKAHNLEVVSSSLAPATRKKIMRNYINIEVSEREEETRPTGYSMM